MKLAREENALQALFDAIWPDFLEPASMKEHVTCKLGR
jgi:hypothetical protein